jgi:hypothetical protein
VPFKSEAQRRLFYAASNKSGGVGGVSQKVAKNFIKDDKPGKLPEHKSKMSKLYDRKKD